MTDSFRDRVYELVSQIPIGRVMTYGDVAVLCGSANSARIVGGIAHFGPTDLPWHRVVNRFGGLASGYYGGKQSHQSALELEGIEVRYFQIINFNEVRWLPKHP